MKGQMHKQVDQQIELIYAQIRGRFCINVDAPSITATPTTDHANEGKHEYVDDI